MYQTNLFKNSLTVKRLFYLKKVLIKSTNCAKKTCCRGFIFEVQKTAVQSILVSNQANVLSLKHLQNTLSEKQKSQQFIFTNFHFVPRNFDSAGILWENTEKCV